MTRIIGGDAGGRRIKRPPASTPARRPTGCARRSSAPSSRGAARSRACASSTCTPARAPSASRPGPAAPAPSRFVESDRRTSRLVYENAKLLGFHRAHVMTVPVSAALDRQPPAPYDIVFSDPPYHLADADGRRRPRAARRPGLGGAGRHGRGRALGPQPGARVARRLHRDPRAQVRRDDALVRSRRVARREEMRVCPGPSTRSPTATSTSSAGPRSSSTRSSSRSASTRPRAGSSAPTSGSRCSAGRGGPRRTSRVDGFTGLITTYCQEIDAQAIVKGLRSGTDFDYELQMAQMNAQLTGVETMFITAEPAVRLRLVQPGQGGRRLRRRRVGPGAGLRPGRARRPQRRSRVHRSASLVGCAAAGYSDRRICLNRTRK